MRKKKLRILKVHLMSLSVGLLGESKRSISTFLCKCAIPDKRQTFCLTICLTQQDMFYVAALV